MSNWRLLLDRTLRGLDRLKETGHPAPDWILGGGTALMICANHRTSRDIDAFIDDPQYLALLCPDAAAEDVWNCLNCNKSANFLKLYYEEGEIDFIVTAPVSSVPPVARGIDLTTIRAGYKPVIYVDQPAEIALKKMHYRAEMLKARDIFDIAVVDAIDNKALLANLHEVADKRDDLLNRLDTINERHLQATLAELDIQPEWTDARKNCLEIVRSILEQIPKPTRTV
ncbi:MAG: nucleotidyl transferase AbiEii/AbiGii toxin family protein [Bradyrhizobium sp.]